MFATDTPVAYLHLVRPKACTSIPHIGKQRKQDIANSNIKFRAYLEQEERRAKAAQEPAQRERDRIEQLNKRLDFE